MSARGVFRSLIVLAFLIPFVTPVAAMLSCSTLPAPLLNYLQSEPSGSMAAFSRLPRSVAILSGALAIAAAIFATIGLFTFRRWGRSLYVLLTVLYMVCMPFMGPLVLPAALTPLFCLSYLIQGGIIAMAYLPPITQLYAIRKA